MNFWHERFNTDDYIYGVEPNEFLVKAHSVVSKKGSTLAIAEGEGRNAVYLAEQGMNVTTWDYAKSGLEKTQKLAQSRGVSVQTELVDLQEAEWQENQWDEIVCIFGHFPKPLRLKTLQGIKTAVKPEGYFISEVYSPYQIPYESGGPKEEALLYHPEEFIETFQDWRIVHFFMGEVTREEGEYHKGLSHVIQFIGQKTNLSKK